MASDGAVLLAFGLIHLCLIWNGDILTEYALAGLIVVSSASPARWPSASPSTPDRYFSAPGGCAVTDTARSSGCGAR
jgi:hypothetical protein